MARRVKPLVADKLLQQENSDIFFKWLYTSERLIARSCDHVLFSFLCGLTCPRRGTLVSLTPHSEVIGEGDRYNRISLLLIHPILFIAGANKRDSSCT